MTAVNQWCGIYDSGLRVPRAASIFSVFSSAFMAHGPNQVSSWLYPALHWDMQRPAVVTVKNSELALVDKFVIFAFFYLYPDQGRDRSGANPGNNGCTGGGNDMKTYKVLPLTTFMQITALLYST